MGMKNKKKNSDKIKNPFVARPCDGGLAGALGEVGISFRQQGVRTTTPWSQAKQARSMAWVIREYRAVMYPAIKTKIANSLCLLEKRKASVVSST